MAIMDKTENVKTQYEDDNNLAKRIKLHSKHSTNKQGFDSWLFGKYAFANGNRILELGCGNGGQWEGRILQLPSDCLLVLSDFSKGMVDLVWNKFSNSNNLLVQRIDIQDIPFPDESFEVVIANHMLYHIPDLSKALSEVNRVLKNGGKFFSTTNGINGMYAYLHNAMKILNPKTTAFSEGFSFNLQNGAEILKGHFSNVERIDYEDSLHITNTQDLIEWIKSTMTTISSVSENELNNLYDYFEDIRNKEGAIKIPKEGGLFVSTK